MHRPLSRTPLGVTAICAAFAALLGISGSASADLIVSAENVTASAGSTGNDLQVTLTNTGSSAVVIGGFSFGISVNSTDVTFQDALITTTPAYIFAGHSLFGPSIATLTGQSLVASDEYDSFGSGATVAAGATVGLGDVKFDVAPFPASSFFDVFVDLSPTSLSDALGKPIPVDSTVNGSISLRSVPEPSAIALGAVGGLAILAKRRFRPGRGTR